MNNPRRCYDGSRNPQEIRIETFDASKNLYKIAINYHNRYIYADLVSQKVKWTQDQSIIDSDQTLWYIEKDVFVPGTYAIRHASNFIRSKQSSSQDLELVTENLVVIHNLEELSWDIQCTSDDFGALIDQPSAPFTQVAELTPTCDGSSLSASLPSLPAGGYKIIARSSEYGAATGVIDITFGLSIATVVPSRIGTGGGTPLTITGSGFTEATAASMCGEQLTFISYTAGATAGDAETIIFDTVPVLDVNTCAGNPLVLAGIDAATGLNIDTA